MRAFNFEVQICLMGWMGELLWYSSLSFRRSISADFPIAAPPAALWLGSRHGV